MGYSEHPVAIMVAALLSCKNLFSAHLQGLWLMVLMQVPLAMLVSVVLFYCARDNVRLCMYTATATALVLLCSQPTSYVVVREL